MKVRAVISHMDYWMESDLLSVSAVQGGQSSASLLFRCFPIRLSRNLEQANVSRDLADVVFSLLYEKPENTYAALGQSLFLVSMLSQFLFRDPCTSRVLLLFLNRCFFFHWG